MNTKSAETVHPPATSSRRDDDGQLRLTTKPPSPSSLFIHLSPISERWLLVIGAFFIFFNAWGLLLAFGTFEVYYENDLLAAYSRSDISWIATVAAFLLLIGGTFTGTLYDNGFMRPMLLIGSFMVVLGIMMTSLARRYYEVFLAEGVCTGIGLSLLWIPALSCVASRFQGSTRTLTIGIISSGSSLGGVLYPLIFSQLQPQIGFAWTVRVVGFLAMFTLGISLLTMLPAKSPSPSVRRIIDVSALKDWPFMSLMLSGFFVLLGYYIPIVYLPTYTLTAVDGRNAQHLAFYTVVIVNAASCPSRISAGIVAGYTGPMPAYILALASSSILLLAWIAVKSVAGIVIWAILYGFTTGLVISIPGSIVPLLCPNPSLIGTRMGMAWFGAALGILLGSPIGGALIRSTETGSIHWWPLQLFSGLAMLIGGLLCIPPYLDIHKRQKHLTT